MIVKKYLNKENMMRWRTCFSSISYYGYKLDILKSGIQKYLRRKVYDKMVWCVMEIWLFQGLVDENKEKAATGIITNLINRLIVMCDEELLFADYERYILIREYLDMYSCDRYNVGLLIKASDLLVKGRILRRQNDIRAYFGRNMGYGREIAAPKNILLKNQSNNFLNSMISKDKVSFINFKYYFEMDDIRCMYWALKILHNKNGLYDGEVKEFEIKYIFWDLKKEKNKKENKKVRKKENVYNIWKYLFDSEYVKNNRILRTSLEYRLRDFDNKKKKERFMFMTAAIDLVMMVKSKRITINSMEVSCQLFKENYETVCTEEYMNGVIEKLFKDRKNIVIDDYVIDMHTSLGRKMKKNKQVFAEEGSLVVEEDKEYYVKEWRDIYVNEKIIYEKILEKRRLEKENKKEENKKSKKTDREIVRCEKNKNKKSKKTDREIVRCEKNKRIKKLRGKSVFNDLEKDLEVVSGIEKEKINLCTKTTCGNKVMCFEYEGKIWKEGRKSMNYNRDYCVVDECKEFFGLKKIGMKRVLADFKIQKIDNSIKSWENNWRKVMIQENEEKIVYCVMDKIEPGSEIGKNKDKLLKDKKLLKEFVKIGVFRGIFRVSDFNGRNVLMKKGLNNDIELVSIDEGDIGKRVDIIGRKECWLVKELNKDKSIINEILNEIKGDDKCGFLDLGKRVSDIMKKYKFNDDMCKEVIKNWSVLEMDLKKEGVEFE
jgi:hypothetical protein